MKKILALLILLVSLTTFSFGADKEKNSTQLRHVVLFGFKANVTPDEVKAVESAFLALPAQIKCIKSIEWGIDISPEGLQKGHTHCFFLTFGSEKDRDEYLVHPAHKAFGAMLGEKLSTVTVLDYWAKQENHLIDCKYLLVSILNPDNAHITIEISDNGFGISEENIPHVFEPFFSTKHNARGTGLGLAIVKKNIEYFGGNIWLETEVEKGTSFFIELPVIEEPQ